MKARQLFTFLLFLILLSAGMSFAGVVDFESQPLNATYGSAYGQSPNDLVFVEDGVLVYITSYYNGSNQQFNQGKVKNSITTPFSFYNGHIFQLSNVGALFLFGGPGNASFEYAHFGGPINIAINGAGVLVANHFEDLAGTLAPGITMSVTTNGVAGAHWGTVTFTGDISRLQIGGQELLIDEVHGGGSVLPHEECDYLIDHESLNVGTSWGGDFGDSPGDAMFIEAGIKVYAQEFAFDGGGSAFGEASIQMTPVPDFGNQRVMFFNKFASLYSIASLEIITSSVTFEILAPEGAHNLKVNDGPLFVGDFSNMPSQVDSDITMTVNTVPFSGGYKAVVTLVGNVQELTVGGESLYLDNLCVIEAGATSPVPQEITNAHLKVDRNFPNPFNPSTTISFTTEFAGLVELSVVDLAGHRVATLVNESLSAGSHDAVWHGRTVDGRKAPAGVYFVQLRSGHQVVSRKITMVK